MRVLRHIAAYALILLFSGMLVHDAIPHTHHSHEHEGHTHHHATSAHHDHEDQEHGEDILGLLGLLFGHHSHSVDLPATEHFVIQGYDLEHLNEVALLPQGIYIRLDEGPPLIWRSNQRISLVRYANAGDRLRAPPTFG